MHPSIPRRSTSSSWTDCGYHGSCQLWDCSGLFFGRLFGAHLVHKTLQVGCFCATERTLSDSKLMKRGVYEQGTSKPPATASCCSYACLKNRRIVGCTIEHGVAPLIEILRVPTAAEWANGSPQLAVRNTVPSRFRNPWHNDMRMPFGSPV